MSFPRDRDNPQGHRRVGKGRAGGYTRIDPLNTRAGGVCVWHKGRMPGVFKNNPWIIVGCVALCSLYVLVVHLLFITKDRIQSTHFPKHYLKKGAHPCPSRRIRATKTNRPPPHIPPHLRLIGRRICRSLPMRTFPKRKSVN